MLNIHLPLLIKAQYFAENECSLQKQHKERERT